MHSNGPDCVPFKVLDHLKDELGLPADGEGIEDLWEAFIELDVHNGTNTLQCNDGDNLALVSLNIRGHRENWRSTNNRFSRHICTFHIDQFIHAIQKLHQNY